MNDSNTISLLIAVIAALSSLLVAGVSYLSSRKNARDLESLKVDLAEKQAEKNARRDYLYEARKRLYREVEERNLLLTMAEGETDDQIVGASHWSHPCIHWLSASYRQNEIILASERRAN